MVLDVMGWSTFGVSVGVWVLKDAFGIGNGIHGARSVDCRYPRY